MEDSEVRSDEHESKVNPNLEQEVCVIEGLTCHRGIVSVLTLKHIDGKGNRSMLELVSQEDLVDYSAKEQVEEKLCRKDKVSGMQRKLSCWPCTIVMESVQVEIEFKCRKMAELHFKLSVLLFKAIFWLFRP